jgi:hypothetical protein
MPRRLRHAFALGRFVARHGTISEIGLPQVAILTTAQFAAMVLLLLYLPHRLKSLVTRVVEEQTTRERLDSAQVLDALLADGRPYLTAASLIAPLVSPKEHPLYGKLVFPPAVANTMHEWAERPSLRWVRSVYALHR